MLPSRSTSASFHEKAEQEISEKIASGIWQPHNRISSETKLVAQYDFSRMATNRALRELTDEGLLVCLQSVGMFVAEPKGQSALFEIRSVADEISARRHQHQCEVLTLGKTQADAQRALVLNVKGDTSVFHSVMVRYGDGLPVQIGDRCVNAEVVPEYLAQDCSQTTPHAYLSLIASLAEGEHIAEAIRASAGEYALLNVREHDPCLLVRRKT